MTKPWTDPVKNHGPKPETLAIRGDFAEFTNLMRRVVTKEQKQPIPASVSPVPAAQKGNP